MLQQLIVLMWTISKSTSRPSYLWLTILFQFDFKKEISDLLTRANVKKMLTFRLQNTADDCAPMPYIGGTVLLVTEIIKDFIRSI